MRRGWEVAGSDEAREVALQAVPGIMVAQVIVNSKENDQVC